MMMDPRASAQANSELHGWIDFTGSSLGPTYGADGPGGKRYAILMLEQVCSHFLLPRTSPPDGC